MTDRELLEAAAKAAGIELGEWCEELDAFWKGKTGDTIWNPLTDDGDALRLAVKLNIDHGNPGMRLSIDWKPGDDPYAATRRVIVRAAAEIGNGTTQKVSTDDLPEDNYYKTQAEAEELGRSMK